ncbi:MAG: hypothetical protein AB1724_07685 [Thermodesulfobacteriota bacterium]
MKFKVLSNREAAILAAVGRGIIPPGGPHFAIGAGDLEGKWLPRADYAIFRMPFFTRLAIRITLRVIDYLLPIYIMKRIISITRLDNARLENLMDRAEKSGIFGAAAMVIVKVLIFPAFYGLPEAQAAIGYNARFPVPPYFESLKE